jgi:hypothetical protein
LQLTADSGPREDPRSSPAIADIDRYRSPRRRQRRARGGERRARARHDAHRRVRDVGGRSQRRAKKNDGVRGVEKVGPPRRVFFALFGDDDVFGDDVVVVVPRGPRASRPAAAPSLERAAIDDDDDDARGRWARLPTEAVGRGGRRRSP